MNSSPEPGLSKGVMMIAAYRAARLGHRPVLPTSLQQARSATPEGPVPDQEHDDPRPTAPTQLVPTMPATGLAHEMKEKPSIFAGLVNSAVPVRWPGSVTKGLDLETANDRRPLTVEVQLPLDHLEPAVPKSLVPESPVAESPVAESPVAEAINAVLHDPPLAEIGFGPGMLIRLSQLGLHTMSDLARSDATQLRVALGDISRLLDVEAWIRSARRIATWAQTQGQVTSANQA